MLLNPYILKENEPVRQLFLQIPCLNSKEPWTSEAAKEKTQFLSLDILPKDKDIYVLLGSPDWEEVKITHYVDIICSNLRMLMTAFGLVEKEMTIHWFETVHIRKEVLFRSFTFGRDDGIWLSDPQWQDISLDDVPFNVEAYRILLS